MLEQVGVKSPEEVVIILLREGKGNEWFLMVTQSTKKIRFWEGLLTDSEEQYLTVIVKHTCLGLGDPVPRVLYQCPLTAPVCRRRRKWLYRPQHKHYINAAGSPPATLPFPFAPDGLPWPLITPCSSFLGNNTWTRKQSKTHLRSCLLQRSDWCTLAPWNKNMKKRIRNVQFLGFLLLESGRGGWG